MKREEEPYGLIKILNSFKNWMPIKIPKYSKIWGLYLLWICVCILRNHYANQKVECSAKYREDHPDTPHRPYQEESEASEDSLKSITANLANLDIQPSQECEPSLERDIELNKISAHLATLRQEQVHIVTPQSSQ